MAQLVNYLLEKHEDLSSDPRQPHRKSKTVCNPRTGQADRILGVYCSVNLAKSVSSKLVVNLYSL